MWARRGCEVLVLADTPNLTGQKPKPLDLSWPCLDLELDKISLQRLLKTYFIM